MDTKRITNEVVRSSHGSVAGGYARTGRKPTRGWWGIGASTRAKAEATTIPARAITAVSRAVQSGCRGRTGPPWSSTAPTRSWKSPIREGLNLAGDMTFMAWVQTTSDDGRDRLIFGDTAGLAVNRNISIELDRGALYVGHGNDAQYESFSPGLKFDGNWNHLAIVFEQPRYYLYVNGVLHETGELAMPLSRTRGAGRSIGGWYAGYSRASSTKSGSTTGL